MARKKVGFGTLLFTAVMATAGAGAQTSTEAAANVVQVQLNAPATVPVRIQSWGTTLGNLQVGDTCRGTVAGNVYQNNVAVVPDGTPVVGRIVSVGRPALEGGPSELRLELIWAALPAPGSRGEIAAIATEPLDVSVGDTDIKDARVFRFATASPLSVRVPLVDGQPLIAAAASKDLLFSGE